MSPSTGTKVYHTSLSVLNEEMQLGWMFDGVAQEVEVICMPVHIALLTVPSANACEQLSLKGALHKAEQLQFNVKL